MALLTKRRRWFQFSMMDMLMVMLLLSVLFASFYWTYVMSDVVQESRDVTPWELFVKDWTW